MIFAGNCYVINFRKSNILRIKHYLLVLIWKSQNSEMVKKYRKITIIVKLANRLSQKSLGGFLLPDKNPILPPKNHNINDKIRRKRSTQTVIIATNCVAFVNFRSYFRLQLSEIQKNVIQSLVVKIRSRHI